MLEKWTKKVGAKATDGVVEGAKESLNDKLETYSGIIKVGLTLAVIIFGSIKINDHHMKKQEQHMRLPPSSMGYCEQPQQPIIINNYISDGRYSNPYGRQGKNHQKH